MKYVCFTSQSIALFQLLLATFFLSSLSELHITFPPNLSSITLEDSGLILWFQCWTSPSAAGLTVKIDVIGSADPSGWPRTHLRPLEAESSFVDGRERKLFRGSVEIGELSPGAVEIRLRALTPDGTDAIGEDTSRLFLDASKFFDNILISQAWLRPIAVGQYESCCRKFQHSCFAFGSHVEFCKYFQTQTANGELLDTAQFLNLHLPQIASTAVVALIGGYDHERLLPFVESLRASGYGGEIHLIPVTPEITCDWEASLSCIRLQRYLQERHVFIHPFPDEIEYCRQHTRQHDYLIKLQIIGHFCAGRGRSFSSIMVVEASRVIFQQDPAMWLASYQEHGLNANKVTLIAGGHSELDSQIEQGLNACWSRSPSGGYGVVMEDFIAGPPELISQFIALQLVIAWQLISDGGLACAIPVWYHPPPWAAIPVSLVTEDTGFHVNVRGPEEFCRMGLARGVSCGPAGVSRQQCLNMGCCYRALKPWETASSLPDILCVHPVIDPGSVQYRLEQGRVVSQEGGLTAVLGYSKDSEIVQALWRQLAPALRHYFPPRERHNTDGRLPGVAAAQARVDDLLGHGRWEGDVWRHSEWAAREAERLLECLRGSDVHMFGDSRMRGLSFSLMQQLNHSVIDADGHLKNAVVPVEAQDLCAGNRRYENHVACGSLLGYALRLPDHDATVAFHELFHYDHGPTLAATILQLITDARRAVPRRRLVIAMAPGFHMVSSSPVEGGSIMSNFLPQILDALWGMHDGFELALWLTMEPTSGGPGAWPELDRVNDVANRTVRASGAMVLMDTARLAAGRGDLLVDGSHYSPIYRRVAAQLLLASVCPS